MQKNSEKNIIEDLTRVVREHPDPVIVSKASKFLKQLRPDKTLIMFIIWNCAISFLKRYKIEDVIYNSYPCIIIKRWHSDYFDLQTKSKTEKYIIETFFSVEGYDIRKQGNELESNLDY